MYYGAASDDGPGETRDRLLRSREFELDPDAGELRRNSTPVRFALLGKNPDRATLSRTAATTYR